MIRDHFPATLPLKEWRPKDYLKRKRRARKLAAASRRRNRG